MKIAVIHEWLTTMGGSEKVLAEILNIFPTADLFVLVLDKKNFKNSPILVGRTVYTSFIQNFPAVTKRYRSFLPLMPLAIEQFDLSTYDLIISSSHAVAKGVLTGPDQLHISYVHSPIRYAWDLQHQYLKESRLTGLKGLVARWLLHKIRIWDYRTGAGVNNFIANSKFISRRIEKVYGRTSDVIYPPVAVEDFPLISEKENFYLTASRLVPYKRIDLIIKAFGLMPDKKLIVIGDGPEFRSLKALATKNVQMLGHQPFAALVEHMSKAKAFIFAAEEDFGIIPVEAQACGTPVIAYGKGGALETVSSTGCPSTDTGLFFGSQTPDAIVSAVQKFESGIAFSPYACRTNAERFSTARFHAEFHSFVLKKAEQFFTQTGSGINCKL